jgi:hypothetical protein
MMKCKMMIAVVLGMLAANGLAKEKEFTPRQFGIGIIAGEPTGLSVKYWLDDTQAIDGAAAWSFWDDDGFQLHADYLWHNFDLIDAGGVEGKLPVYYGVGARLKFEEDNGKGDDGDTVFGIRVPLGISYLFEQGRLDVFAEIVPVLDLAPDVDLDLQLAVGLRFYIQ